MLMNYTTYYQCNCYSNASTYELYVHTHITPSFILDRPNVHIIANSVNILENTILNLSCNAENGNPDRYQYK